MSSGFQNKILTFSKTDADVYKRQIHIYTEQPMTLVIEDTGIGIAAEDLPRLFEKGFTGYNGCLLYTS